MKLLFCMEHLYPPLGGAERSIDTLIQELRKDDAYQVSYLCSNNAVDATDHEIFFQGRDVVVTQLNWSAQSIRAARKLGMKSIQFVRSLEGFCAVVMDSFAVSHCGQRCLNCYYRLRDTELEVPDLLIANSKYTQLMLKQEFGLSSEIVYPFIDTQAVIVPRKPRRFITMNQMAYHKGADIFIKLARVMPDLEFRLVGTPAWLPDMAVPSNLKYVGPVTAEEIYSETKVFLAPARINESFGRCVVEAQMNGIPVLSSNRGGPRYDELVNEKYRIDEIDDIDRWEDRLRWLLANYDAAAEEAASRDFSFCSLESNVRRFLELVEQVGELPAGIRFHER